MALERLLGNKGAHVYYGNNLYQCDKCKRIYKTPKTLQNHKCTYCCHCGKLFSNYPELRTHNCIKLKDTQWSKNFSPKSRTVDELSCEYCNKAYKSLKTLKNHKCSFCKVCGVIFSSHQWLLKHKCLQGMHNVKSESRDQKIETSFSESCKMKTCSSELSKVSESPERKELLKPTMIQNAGIVRTMYSMENLVKKTGTMITDDVICAALTLIRDRTGSPYHGHITPAEMTLYLQNPSVAKSPVPSDQLSINIHNIGEHWVTSVYDPLEDTFWYMILYTG